jgi:hypothetical protein
MHRPRRVLQRVPHERALARGDRLAAADGLLQAVGDFAEAYSRG